MKSKKKAQVILTSEPVPYQGRILNAQDKTYIGSYSLLQPADMKSTFGTKQWYYRKNTMNINNCKYLGEERGWCALTLFSSPWNESLLYHLFRVCRGIFKDVHAPTDPYPCLIFYSVWCNFDRGFKNHKPAITHAVINRNLTPATFEFLVPFGSPTSYSRHLNNVLVKLETGSNKPNELCWVWCWVFSTFMTKDLASTAPNLDNYWLKLKDTPRTKTTVLWLESMTKEYWLL